MKKDCPGGIILQLVIEDKFGYFAGGDAGEGMRKDLDEGALVVMDWNSLRDR